MSYKDFINNPDLDIMLGDIDILSNIIHEPWNDIINKDEFTVCNSMFARIIADPEIDQNIKEKVFSKVDYFFGSYENVDKHYKTTVTSYKNICWQFASMFLDIPGFKDVISPWPIAGISSDKVSLTIRNMFKDRLFYFYNYDNEQRKLRKQRQSEDEYGTQRKKIISFYKRFLLVPVEKITRTIIKNSEWNFSREIEHYLYNCNRVTNKMFWKEDLIRAEEFLEMSYTLLTNTDRYIKDYELEKIFKNYQKKFQIVNPLENSIIVKQLEVLKNRCKNLRKI